MSRHVALVIHALHGGGAERVAARLANLWAERGEQITIITLDTVESDVYRVDPRVKRIGLGLMGTSRNVMTAIWNNRCRIAGLRKAIKTIQPDCVVGVTDQINVITLLACRRLKVPVVIAEHSDPRHQDMGRIWERLRRWSYPQAMAIVVLTQSVAEHMRLRFGHVPIRVIANGIAPPVHELHDGDEGRRKLVVAMGRLSAEKGFDRLIDAFAQVASPHDEWTLEIAGEGLERNDLQQRIDRQRLGDRVTLMGWVDEPETWLSQAAIFVLSSRYEGFPVSLLEAMSLGLAVISFDCDSGPREIIRHQVDGLLVRPGDVAGLAQAMQCLIDDPALRHRLGQAARNVVERFSPARFIEQWNAVLDDATQPPGSSVTNQQS